MIAAAFIGPGTVATATRAGAAGGYAYLPVVGLAAVAGWVYLEMAARLTIVSGRSLGELLRLGNQRWIPILLYGGVVFGCAAYQAGNLLGALAGLQLLVAVERYWIVLFAAGVALLLWRGSPQTLGRRMAYLVGTLGLLFVLTAGWLLLGGPAPPIRSVGLEDGGIWLALLGTTIVPYNFFLAAGLGEEGEVVSMRRGLLLSFGVGALITACIVVVGASVTQFVSFADLGNALTRVVGAGGRWVLGLGLLAAGLSSAATAPLAAAIAGKELLGWSVSGTGYRLTWLGVLVSGLLVGLLQLDLVGVILTAQIINGLLLPFVAATVLLLANRKSLLGSQVNPWWQNLAGVGVLGYLLFKTGQFFYNLVV